MIIEQLQRLNTLEQEKTQLLDKLDQSYKENQDLLDRLHVAIVSLKAITDLQNTGQHDKTAKVTSQAKEIAQATIEVIS